MKSSFGSTRLALTCGLLVIAMATAGALPAAATSTDEPESAFDLVEAAAPDVTTGVHTDAERTADGLEYAVDSGVVTAPLEASAPVSMEIDGVDYSLGLPVTAGASLTSDDPSAPTFDNNDGSSTSVLVKDSQITVASILSSVEAPEAYSYDYSGMGEIRQDPTDGGVTVWRDGVMVSALYQPWAIDAAGAEVPTRYEINGSTLTQVVEHRGAAYAYPIVADPSQTLPGSNSYYAKIILNIDSAAGTTIVSVYPAAGVNWTRVARSTGVNAYNAIVPSTYESQKYHDQLVCHWASAGYFKTPWNLDSWRPNVGYAATVAAWCNPN